VPPSYVQYVAVDRRGRTVVGMIAAQTATSVTLKREGDVAETVLRTDLRELSSTGLSLMPEGLERTIDPPSMADLLAFLEQAMAGSGGSTPDRERDFGTLPGLVEPPSKTGRR
jgi:putative heme-binding domain-containing protein